MLAPATWPATPSTRRCSCRPPTWRGLANNRRFQGHRHPAGDVVGHDAAGPQRHRHVRLAQPALRLPGRLHGAAGGGGQRGAQRPHRRPGDRRDDHGQRDPDLQRRHRQRPGGPELRRRRAGAEILVSGGGACSTPPAPPSPPWRERTHRDPGQRQRRPQGQRLHPRPHPRRQRHQCPHPGQPGQHQRHARHAGDVAGNAFDSPLFVPATDVAQLANNRRFQDIDIQQGTWSGTTPLALNAIGTSGSPNLRDVFPAGFTVQQGAAVNVGPNVHIAVPAAGETITVNGTLTFNGGTGSDRVDLNSGGAAPAEILVSGGGAPAQRHRHRLHLPRRSRTHRDPGKQWRPVQRLRLTSAPSPASAAPMPSPRSPGPGSIDSLHFNRSLGLLPPSLIPVRRCQ